jgi:alcohol dehydrogenase
MKTQSAVLYQMELPRPYTTSNPMVVEELELDGPGEGEVLVELRGAGLCHSDLSVIDGSRPRPVPMVLGHEAAGIVREVGAGVTNFKPDDHVVFSYIPMCGRCVMCLGGRPALCENGAQSNTQGTLLSGARRFMNAKGELIHHHIGVSGFSQYTVAAQESLVKLDPSFPLDKAALFGCAVITGVGAVVNTAKVEAGASVAVFGLGGVGLSVLMGARAAGAYPIIAVDVLDSKLDLAHELGATHTVNAATGDPVVAIKDLTRGGAHYAFESVGNEKVLQQAYYATRRGGTTVTIGLPHPSKQFSVSAVTMVAEERTIKGSFMGSGSPLRDVPRFIAMYQAGLLPVDMLYTKRIALEDINEGFESLAKGEVVRQVITFTG